MRIEVRTARREDLVDVTARVAELIAAADVEAGIAVVSSPHTTAGVTVNENADPDVVRDVLHGLERIVPRDGGWHHFEGNSDAHLKTAIVGTSAVLPIAAGRLALGMWQAIYLAEFDGPRTRKLDITVVPGLAGRPAERGFHGPL